MNQGHCYKLFRELMDYTDATFKCHGEKGILAEPKTFTQAEFLESFVSYIDKVNKTESFEKTIFLGHRLDDLEDTVFFDIIKGHGDGDYASQSGDCVAMSMDSLGNHKGWIRQPCNTLSHFICQTSKNNLIQNLQNISKTYFIDETLDTKYLPHVVGPRAVFPLNKDIGSRNAIGAEKAIKIKNVGWDTLWVPTFQLGSAMFSKKLAHLSHMMLDLSGALPSPTKLSILLWARPTSASMGVALVSEIVFYSPTFH